MNGFQMNGRVVEPQKQSMLVELLLMRKTQTKLQQKCVSHSHNIFNHEKESGVFFFFFGVIYRIL